MDYCEQCRTHEARYIDAGAALWCPRCAERRTVGGEGEPVPYLWLMSERIHFLTRIYPLLGPRYKDYIEDPRNPLWAKKLGVTFAPPGQRAVDTDAPPYEPYTQQEVPVAAPWAIHVDEDGKTEIWVLKSTPAQLAMQQQPPRAELESWHRAQRARATYERTKETVRKAQAWVAAQKRAQATLEEVAPRGSIHDRWALNRAGRWERRS